jgi:copper(I)-binding protein
LLLKSIVAAIVFAIGLAACQPAEPLAISGAEFRPPLGASDVGAAYFTLTSAKPDRIIAVTSPQADSIEIHASVTEGGRTSMQRLETVDLPAGRPVEFAPGGMHLMVFSPHPEAGGGDFPIIIELQSGAKRTISFRYRRNGEDPHG